VILDLILIGLAITLDPLPLTAFLVILPSKRGTVKGAAFVFGWLVSLGIVVTITVLATGNNPPKPSTAPSLSWSSSGSGTSGPEGGPSRRRSRPSGNSTWTPCPRGSPWRWPPRCSPGR